MLHRWDVQHVMHAIQRLQAGASRGEAVDPGLEDGEPVEIINFIDDHSRAVLASVAVPVATAAHVVRIFYESAAIYGLPASVLSDNGAIYTAAYRGSHTGMEIELAALGITFKLHHVGVGRAHRDKRVLILVADLDVRVIDEDGAMIRHLELDPSVDYQRRDRDIV